MPEIVAAHLERVAREWRKAHEMTGEHGEYWDIWGNAEAFDRALAAALAACAREARLEEAKQAERLLDRYREKARLLVIQTGGSYDSGEAIQFLVSDYEKYKQHVRALERAVGEKGRA